jgi:hypothetical protein
VEVVLLGESDRPRSSSERMHVMGRTGTLALTGQSRRCSDDVVFALGEDDEGEVEEEVEWDEPMVSVRDLDWKRDGSLGYFIVLDEDRGEEDQLRNFGVLVDGGESG